MRLRFRRPEVTEFPRLIGVYSKLAVTKSTSIPRRARNAEVEKSTMLRKNSGSFPRMRVAPTDFGDLQISRFGRTAPLGEVTLTSNGKAVKVDRGSAMLLRVNGSESEEAPERMTTSRGTAR